MQADPFVVDDLEALQQEESLDQLQELLAIWYARYLVLLTDTQIVEGKP